MKTFILLGATGDLAKQKILPILSKIDANVILYARKPIESDFTSVVGDLDNFKPLVNYLEDRETGELYFYLALPPDLYESTILSVQKYFGESKVHIALEKPFGNSFENAKKIADLITQTGKDKFYIVDHYLAKEALINNDALMHDKRMKSIHVGFLEKENVENRGVFYDKIGAIKDTGQNHLLNMLSQFLNPKDRIEVLKNLKYKNGSLETKQYDGYKKVVGVEANSKTETYFKAEFNYKGISVTLETGKNLPVTKTFINVNYKDGTNYELIIKPNPKEIVSAHQIVIEDFLSGKNKFSLSLTEALESWEIISQLDINANISYK